MYHNILVPLDGSMVAEHALPWALSLAQQEQTSLNLIRVHLPPAPIMVGSELASDVGLDAVIRENETAYLNETLAKLRPLTTIPIHAQLVDGSTGDAIQDRARALKSDLLVMTTHGRSALARFWLGSVADQIIRHSTVPTLLVRPIDEFVVDLTVRPFIRRVVIPLDGSALSESILEPAIKLGKACGSEFSLILVLDAVEDIEALAAKKVKVPGGWFPEATQVKAEAYLEKVAHRLRGHSLIVHTKVIPHGSAAGSILEYANTHGHSVVALATHGRSGLKRVLLGSTADKVIRGATMPVLIFHPADVS